MLRDLETTTPLRQPLNLGAFVQSGNHVSGVYDATSRQDSRAYSAGEFCDRLTVVKNDLLTFIFQLDLKELYWQTLEAEALK